MRESVTVVKTISPYFTTATPRLYRESQLTC